MSSIAKAALALVALFCTLTFARQAFAEDAEEGRRQYKRGQDFLQAGDYRAAAQSFEAGYAAAPRPGFLLNIANCYRKLGELGKARQYYWRFLDQAPKDHASRPEVLEFLRTIEQINADGVALDGTETPARTPEMTPPRADSPPRRSMPLPAVVPADPSAGASPLLLAEQAAVPATTDRHTPFYKKWWFWTAVAGVAAAGATGYLITQRPAQGCAATLGCGRE